MNDRELLELAAKAYADPHIQKAMPDFLRLIGRNEEMGCDVLVTWNPLTDDADALQLVVRLKMSLECDLHNRVRARVFLDYHGFQYFAEQCDHVSPERPAATRRAIVRAAAEVGKGMLTYDEFVLMFPGRFETEEVERAAAEIGRAA